MRLHLKEKISFQKFLAVVILASILLVFLVVHPNDLGIRSALQSRFLSFVSVIKATIDIRSISSEGDFSSIVFLHHSTGHHLIEQGGVREVFIGKGFEFWDHGYNHQGLVRPNGSGAGYSYNIPDDNTNPDGLAQIFSQHLYRWPLNAYSGLMQHDVIILKSCFPVSHITSKSQLDQYKAYYLQIRQEMADHKDHVFILLTPPPLNPAATDINSAARARAFANWLKSKEFLAEYRNIFVFDLFDLLAEPDESSPDQNMLRTAYRDGNDSHPNYSANREIGPVFVQFIIDSIEDYQGFLSLQ